MPPVRSTPQSSLLAYDSRHFGPVDPDRVRTVMIQGVHAFMRAYGSRYRLARRRRSIRASQKPTTWAADSTVAPASMSAWPRSAAAKDVSRILMYADHRDVSRIVLRVGGRHAHDES
jgi:hypothetical protein